MSNIIQITEKFIPATIQPSDRELIIAFQSKKIAECTQEELEDLMDEELTKLYFHLGFAKPGAKDLITLVNYSVKELQTKFKSLSKNEISIAFKSGADKEYGEFFGINPATINQFLKGYQTTQKRAEAKKEYAKILEKMNEKQIPDIEEQFKTARINAESALKSIISTGTAGRHGTVVYDFLDSLKLIELTTEEKRELMEEAKEQLLAEKREQKKEASDRIKRIDITRQIDAIEAGEDSNSVKLRAKKIALESFIQSCIMEDTDLLELIDSRRELFLNPLKKSA